MLCAATLASCAKETPAGNKDTGEKNLLISINNAGTRFTNPATPFGTAANVGNLAIFITNTSGKIVRKVEIAKDEDADSDWTLINSTGLNIPNVAIDATDITVFGNYKAGTTYYVTGDEGDAITVSTTVDQQQGTSVLYSGTKALSEFGVVTEFADGTNVTTYTGTVDVAPALARIQIQSVAFVESGKEDVTNKDGVTAEVEWAGYTGKLIGVYMNNFYGSYDGAAKSLQNNTTWDGNIKEGKWLFGATDAAAYASYNQWATDAYTEYDLNAFNNPALPEDNKVFGFNFFPGAVNPFIHFNIADVTATSITSDDESVYNPDLLPLAKFINIVEYKKSNTAIQLVAGKIYNVNVEIKPHFTHTDLNPVVFNILLSIDIKDWVEENVDPGFQQQ